jgi:glutamate carboxypeptidase
MLTSTRIPTLKLAIILGTLPFVLQLSYATSLNSEEKQILRYIDSHPTDAIDLIRDSVNINSPSENIEGVKKCGAFFKSQFDKLGFTSTWIPMPESVKRAGHLFAERKGTQGKRLLLIGHLDTVLPGGNFVQKADRGYGSGSSDMKGGDVILIMALRALNNIGALDNTQLIAAFTGDEESAGHPIEISRRDLIDAAKRSDITLAFENSVRDTVTTARRGSSSWSLKVTGIQAHSSIIFSEAAGDGAIYEAARILNEFRTELRKEKGLTFNPSVIVGGTDVTLNGSTGTASGKANVIPRSTLVRGDLRFSNPEQLDRARKTMRAIVARHLRRTDATITFEDSYPAMIENQGSLDLLSKINEVSMDLGQGKVTACDPNERGAGDVSFVAPIIPSIDGLGARGMGAHGPGEFIDEKSLNDLTKRTAILIYRLTR